MAHLCALKRTAAFNEVEMRAWYGGLSQFPAWMLNRAIIDLVSGETRFPEFGDLYQRCRRIAIKAGMIKEPYMPNGEAKKGITTDEILSIGQALGLVVENPEKGKQA